MRKLLVLLCLAMTFVTLATPPRKVTPVENRDNKSEKPTPHHYDRHGNPLAEPVFVLVEDDTTASPSAKPVYPLLNSVSAGVNIMDAVMMLAGQKYSSFDISASLSLHNWIFPTVELGIGRADKTPKEGNFTYKCSPSFYAKLGADYNFLYKSSPDYSAFVGLRAGFSSFKYDVDNVTINTGYWDATDNFSLKGQKATALYGEVLAGIKVKIYKRFSMGWTLRYHFKFHESDGADSSPWFIPGFGGKNAPFSATFSLIYTLPLAKATPAATDSPATR